MCFENPFANETSLDPRPLPSLHTRRCCSAPSPQWRNLAEWEWVPIFLQYKFSGECRHGRTVSFCSDLGFPASKHQEKVFVNVLMEVLIIRWRDVWTVHRWLHLSWFGISASSVIHISLSFSCLVIRRTWIFKRPACSISYFFPLTVALRLSSFLNTCYEHTIFKYESCNSHTWMFIRPIFYFAVRKFVCILQQIFMGVNAGKRANLVEARGKCSSHFASHVVGLSV